jgi:hypothetical protein
MKIYKNNCNSNSNFKKSKTLTTKFSLKHNECKNKKKKYISRCVKAMKLAIDIMKKQ